MPLTHAELLAKLHYDPLTGIFTWRVKPSKNRAAGVVAGGLDPTHGRRTYRKICINRKRYYAHRLAYFYVHGVWPTGDTDHEFDGSDAIGNLRPCTRGQNNANATMNRLNTSGFKGVSKHSQCNRWLVTSSGRYVGLFKTKEEAARAYDAFMVKHYGEFARTNEKLGLLPPCQPQS